MDSILAQPKRLACLAYLVLATPGGTQRRDRLVSIFWPELAESNARNSLSQSLHHLRRALGTDTVVSYGTDEVGIDPTRLSCDALDFLDALAEGNLETALDIYDGELLPGLFVSGAPGFERWLDGERATFRRKAFDAALKLGQVAEDRDDLASAARWYQRAMVIIPERGSAVRHLMTVLGRSGSAAEAVQVFDRFATQLTADYGLQPSEETQAVVQSIRSLPSLIRARRLSETPTEQVDVVPTGEPRTSGRPGSRGPRRFAVAAALGAAVIAAGVLFVSYFEFGRESPQFMVSNLRAVTNDPGLEFQPAISPGGSEVAYVAGPIGNTRIAVRGTQDVGSGDAISLSENVSGLVWLPAWAPDGASVRFLTCQISYVVYLGTDCTVKEVSKLGGSVRTVSVPRSSSGYSWSPDGTRVVFAVADSIFAYAADDDEPELLRVQVATGGFQRPHSFAWSPDGSRIAYVNGNAAWRLGTNVSASSIWVLEAKGGEAVMVTDERGMNQSPQWVPDSQHLLFVSDRDGARGIYVIDVGPEGPRGPPRRVPGASDPHSISISANGKRLAYAQFPGAQHIWSIPIPRSGVVSIRNAVPVTDGKQVIESHSLSTDGEWIVFDSNLRGEMGLYKQRIAGGSQQLVVDVPGNAFWPAVSPDGTEIAFYSGVEDADVYVVSASGGTPEQLTSVPGNDLQPAWSPDGLAIAYQSQGPEGVGLAEIWTVSRDSIGGPWADPVQLTNFGNCQNANWAPDGASLVCYVLRGGWLRVSKEGEVLMRYDPSTSGLRSFPVPRFSPDGSRIYFRGRHEDGSDGVWWIPSAGGDATKVVAFDHPSWTVFGYILSVGPENLYLTIAEYDSDIWVMDLNW